LFHRRCPYSGLVEFTASKIAVSTLPAGVEIVERPTGKSPPRPRALIAFIVRCRNRRFCAIQYLVNSQQTNTIYSDILENDG
jgi:hypothetical protein